MKIFMFILKKLGDYMSFQEDLKYGKSAEELMINYFLLNTSYEVKDVSDDEEYQKKEIDLLVTDPESDRTMSVEVKNCTKSLKKYGEIGIESHALLKKEFTFKIGWLWKSEATAFAFVDCEQEKCYLINSKDLRNYILANNRHQDLLKTYVYDDCYKSSWIYYLKPEELKKWTSNGKPALKEFSISE